MSQAEIPDDILAMPVPDRIALVAKIWDSISDDAVEKLSPGQHAILEARLAEHRANPSTGTSWDEVKASLKSG